VPSDRRTDIMGLGKRIASPWIMPFLNYFKNINARQVLSWENGWVGSKWFYCPFLYIILIHW
jgi:hypothetical protein